MVTKSNYDFLLDPEVYDNIHTQVTQVLENIHPQVLEHIHPQGLEDIHPQVLEHIHPQGVEDIHPQVLEHIHPQGVEDIHPQVLENKEETKKSHKIGSKKTFFAVRKPFMRRRACGHNKRRLRK